MAKLTALGIFAVAAALVCGGVVSPAPAAATEQMMDRIHFLVPGGAGGGWDGGARGVGEALVKSELLGNASFENMSGGGGGKAMVYMIDNARSNHGTLMINSTPMIIRGLTGEVKQTFRDMTPVASMLGDYAALVVHKTSPMNTFQDFLEAYKANPTKVAVGGGSVPGGMDHLVASLVLEAAGLEPLAVKYIPYDAGGTAKAALLSGEIQALSTGFSEAIEMAKAEEVKILGVTAKNRLSEYPGQPTFAEQGADMEFVNWRGFFAVPGLPEAELAEFEKILTAVLETPAWEEVRARNGWTTIHHTGADFVQFLEAQENELRELMTELGFL
ncbi:MAG: tripartite tricarboxylate transporter substrate-binding protein [Desulforhopalus sp.]|jgi:putative tricarboxylic transport membrane protein|nr:tripartite tricarboxylate transporter substrate-binding protein [Desulforhopalus sp.]